ncbi:MAG: 3-hydroxyacyl-CoA dehydrogenase NAD-binding domain-containing protein [Bacteroidota bacterium]
MRRIKKIAVLGSGIMGSRIACHFANIGCEVLLLDIVPFELLPEEQAKGLTLENKNVRNRIVNAAFQNTLKTNPSPIYSKKFISRISLGNFTDDMTKITSCDWVIEAVVERLDIKKQVFDNVEKYRKPGTLISTNTSGIPLHMMLDGRSDDFKKHFFGSHFFNPPRYLKLLEIIPTPSTDPSIIDFVMEYGSRHLGKVTVFCKDTPAFIANRVGVYSIMALFHLVKKLNLSVEDVDKLTGPVLGRPKSATFRTCDVVGLDTLIHVANGVRTNCPKDEANAVFALPDYVAKMNENKWWGDKTKQGFYKKIKTPDGKSEILSLDLNTLEYKPQQKTKYATLELTKNIDDLVQRMPVLFSGKDKAGEFYREGFSGLFSYVSFRVPEISDEIYKIDDAMRAGFGWGLGPFECWDAIGIEKGLEVMKSLNISVAPWINEMIASKNASFYKIENGQRKFYDVNSKSYKTIPGTENTLVLSNIRSSKTIWKNSGTTIIDLGDGIINLEFHTKMNTIGGEVIEGLNKAIDLAENNYRGLVISNEGENFSAGANLGMVFMLAAEQEWDELNFAIRAFQNTMMRVRYSSIPVVIAPHGLALGGGCEMCLHADKVIAHAETYMGLVEFGVGVIPGGGGTKEFALRLSDELKEGDVELNQFRNRFLTIGQAKVSLSAQEAFELGYLRYGTDEVIVSRAHQLQYAKEACIELSEKGYTKPVERKDIRILGNSAMGIVYVGANSMMSGNYISDHDRKISEKLGYVLAGGDISQPSLVNEQYLLDLEREAFLSLCGEKKTLERMQSILTGGKILRN